MRQFLTTLDQIAHAESVGTFEGVRRHLQWQVRRLLGDFPCELPISHSKLRVLSPVGVAALVNAMGEYDYNNMRFIRSFLERSGGTFFDVGANIGSYTLIASEILNANVVSIEPHPETFAALAENIRLNTRHNITCLHVAASNNDGTIRLTDGSDSCLNRVLDDLEDPQDVVEVPSRRLETLCQSLHVAPDLIKIDVEGHEPAVLDGLGQYCESAGAILVELGNRPEIQRWMRATSYSGPWYVHFNRGFLSPEPQARPEDPVFIHKRLLGDLSLRNLLYLAAVFSVVQPPSSRSASAWQ